MKPLVAAVLGSVFLNIAHACPAYSQFQGPKTKTVSATPSGSRGRAAELSPCGISFICPAHWSLSVQRKDQGRCEILVTPPPPYEPETLGWDSPARQITVVVPAWEQSRPCDQPLDGTPLRGFAVSEGCRVYGIHGNEGDGDCAAGCVSDGRGHHRLRRHAWLLAVRTTGSSSWSFGPFVSPIQGVERRLTPHCSGLGVSRWRSFLLAAELDIVGRRNVLHSTRGHRCGPMGAISVD